MRADLAHERRSAILIVAEVRRAAAFWGNDLNIELKASGHLLKEVPSSMATSTCFLSARGQSREGLVLTSCERTEKSKPTDSDDLQFS